jgi:hypothetical protein
MNNIFNIIKRNNITIMNNNNNDNKYLKLMLFSNFAQAEALPKTD